MVKMGGISIELMRGEALSHGTTVRATKVVPVCSTEMIAHPRPSDLEAATPHWWAGKVLI